LLASSAGDSGAVLIRLKHDKKRPAWWLSCFGWSLTGVPADAWHSRGLPGTARAWQADQAGATCL